MNPGCLLSVFVRHDGDAFWARLEEAARHDGVALVHFHAGALKSYRLTPAVDRFLKDRLLRARVQLLAAGGDGDTQASAAAVYESVLLGANGGAMTHAAAIALVPEAVDAFAAGADGSAVATELAAPDGRSRDAAAAPDGRSRAAAARDAFAAAVRAVPPGDLREMARCTLTCWQHSILDFLSCMGIDDVKKTSGNTMAITVTEDWVRDVDALATDEFGAENARVNAARVDAEPVPPDVRARFAVSSLLRERAPDLPLVRAAQVLAQRTAGVHLSNSNAALNADFLDVIYRMAAGQLPEVDDFFLAGDPGLYGLDRIGLRVSRASVAWSLARLRRDPALLDYVSLAVPRGFERPGAAGPRATVSIHATRKGRPLLRFAADERGGFEQRVGDDHPLAAALAAAEGSGPTPLWLRASEPGGGERLVELTAVGHGAHGLCVVRASADGAVTLRRDPRGGLVLSGVGVREPIWHGPVCHASTSLGAASEDFLTARVEGNVGLSMTSSGEGGPIKLARDDDMRWESLQVASGHFGVTGRDLRRVRDVEIKINQGAKPGKGGRLSGAKVTPTVSKARNIPVGTDALSPDPKHDIYSIEDMPAEVWLWLLYHNHCGIKITGSNYTRYVAAGMWSNFVVDYLLVDAGMGGSGNYHADSSHVGWPDAFRTMLHTHHALLGEKVDLDGSGELRPLRDGNGAAFGAKGGTRLFASGGLRGELDMLKVLIAGADGLLEGSIGKAVAFGCNQCGNCHLDCPRGGITTKPELMVQNDRDLMRRRFRNWTVLNMVKLAVLVDALNRESGALAEDGSVADPGALLDDIRKLRGRTDLLEMPEWPAAEGDVVPPPATPRGRGGDGRRRAGRGRRRGPRRAARSDRLRGRRGCRRAARPRATGRRARLVPRRLADGERARRRRRHLGGRAALLERRQQPRRRPRLGGIRPGSRPRALLPRRQHPGPGPRRNPACDARPPRRLRRPRRRRRRARRRRGRRAPRRLPPAGPRALRGARGLAARRPARGPRRLPPLLRRAPARGAGALRPHAARRRTLAAAADEVRRAGRRGAGRRPRRPRGRRPAGRRRTGRRGPGRRPPRRLPRRCPRGVPLRPRPPHRLALLPHALRAGRPRRQVRRQALRLSRLDGRGPGRGQDLGLDAHDPRVPRLRPPLGGLPGRPGGRPRDRDVRARRDDSRALRPRLGPAPSLPDELTGDRRRRPRQPGRSAPLQGLRPAADAQRGAGRRRLDLALPARVRLRARRPVHGPGLAGLRGRFPLRPQGAHRHRVRRLPRRLHAPRARADDGGGLAGHLAHHRPRSGGDARGAPAAVRAALAQLRAAHADRAVQVHHRRVAARGRGGGRRRPRGGCRPAPRRLPREHGHQVPAPARARGQRRHR